MKFWNKKKGREGWVCVTLTHTGKHPWYMNDKLLQETKHVPKRFGHLRAWCQKQPSDGKFYHVYGNDEWYFEREEDASYFLFKWMC